MLKIAIYRVIIGDYDNLTNDIFIAAKDTEKYSYSHFLISDKKVVVPSPWQNVVVERQYDSPAMDNRALKLTVPALFDDYDYSVYLDGNISINGNLDLLFDDVVDKGNNLYAYPHYADRTLNEEITACFLYSRISFKDFLNTRAKFHDSLNNKIGFECSIIIRKTGDQNLNKLGDLWFKQYKENARRDQFYFSYAQRETKVCCSSLGENDIRTTAVMFKHHSHKHDLSLLKKMCVVIKVRAYNLLFGKRYA